MATSGSSVKSNKQNSAVKHSWNDLIVNEPTLFEGNGKRSYAILTEVGGTENLTLEDVTKFVQKETAEPFAKVLWIMDGFLVITNHKKSEELRYLSMTTIGKTKVTVNKKFVPYIDDNGFIIEGFCKKKEDLKKHLMRLEKQIYKTTGLSCPFVQQCSNSTSYFVIYERNADIDSIKQSVTNKSEEQQLKVKPMCKSDCIRIGKLQGNVCVADVTKALHTIERCHITHVDLKEHVALVYYANFEDANRIYAKINEGDLEINGVKVNCSLKHHYTQLSSEETNQSTQKDGTFDQGGKNRQNQPSSSVQPNTSKLRDSTNRQKVESNGHTPRGSNRLSKTEKNSSQHTSDVMEFQPDVSYDVLDYVQQTPELTTEIANILGCDVNFKKKSTTTIEGFSMFYALEVKKKKSQKKELSQKSMENAIGQFFDQFDSKSQKFDVYSMEEKRAELGWDRGDETLVQMELKKGEMCQALIRWNDMEKGKVTVTGNRDEIDDILKKLKLATARSVPSTSKYQHSNSQSVSSQHTAAKYAEPKNYIELGAALAQWFNRFGGSDPSCGTALKNVKLDVSSDGRGISLKGNDQEVMRAKHLITELSPQLKTRFHKVESERDLEYLNSTKGNKFIRKKEVENNCAIKLHNKDSSSNKPLGQIPLDRKKPVTLAEGLLNESDVIVSVVQTDITEYHCDAIVNASNEELQLRHAGISGSILDKGGPSIQNEMDQIYYKKGRLITGQAVTTGAGRLPCKKIIHAVGPRWRSSSMSSATELSTCVTSIFFQAEENNLSSVAIPAISSGVFGGDVATCTHLLVKAVHDYLSTNQCCIKEVAFVEMTDSYTLEMFQKELRKVSTPRKIATESQKSSGSGNTSQRGAPNRPAPITHQPSIGHKSSGNIGPITVVVKQGDLSQDDSDVIINPTSHDYYLNNGMVSKVILSRGGYQIQQEVQSWKKTFSSDKFRTTGSGKLPCKKIVHLPIPYESNHWVPLLESVFRKVANDGHRSIALPAIGTGNLKKSTRHSAAIIRKSIENFVSSTKTKYLTEIRIVIFDRSILREFAEVLLSEAQLKRIENKTSKAEKSWGGRDSAIVADPSSPGISLCAMDDEILDRAWSLIKSKLEAIRSEPQIVCDDQVKLPTLHDDLGELFQVEDDCKVSIEIVTKRDGTRVRITGSRQGVSLAKEKCLEVAALWRAINESKCDVRHDQAVQTTDSSMQIAHDQSTDDDSYLHESPPESNSIVDRDARAQSTSSQSDSSPENEKPPARRDHDGPSNQVSRTSQSAITKEKIIEEPVHKADETHQTSSPRKQSSSDNSNDEDTFHDAPESPYGEPTDPDQSAARNPQRQGSPDRSERGQSSRKDSRSEDPGVKAGDSVALRSNPEEEVRSGSTFIASGEVETTAQEVVKPKMSLAANFTASGTSKPHYTDEDWENWRDLDTDQWRIDTVDKDSTRYEQFAKKLQNCDVEIVEIRRIRNPAFFKNFRKATGNRKSRYMFFGVGQFDKVKEICKSGWIGGNREGNGWTIFHQQPLDAIKNATEGKGGERKLFFADVYSPTGKTTSPMKLRESHHAYPLALVTFRSGSEFYV